MAIKILENSQDSLLAKFIEQDQMVNQHNELIQRILELRKKLGNNSSLTDIMELLNELEQNIRGGCELDKIELKLAEIEHIVAFHCLNDLVQIRHIEESELKTKNLTKINSSHTSNIEILN